jgi:hypothetical protein
MRAAKYFGWLATAMMLHACGGGSSDQTGSVTAHKVTGNVSHLTGSGLTISNGSETVSLSNTSTSFSFASSVAEGNTYNVTVVSHPAHQHCEVINGSAKMAHSDASDIRIECHSRVAQPTIVTTYPVADADKQARIILPIPSVGDQSTTINAILDTGSSGVVLNAKQIFPSNIVDKDGFHFPEGSDSLTYKGITVTRVIGVKSYGGGNQMQFGNIGYAQVTMGAKSELTTARIPILFVFERIVETGSGATDDLNPLAVNIVGINPSFAALPASKGSTNLPEPSQMVVCKDVPTSACALLNPLRALTYETGINAGFVLDSFGLMNCSLDIAGNCQPQIPFSVGLTDSVRAPFNTIGLDCPNEATGADGKPITYCTPYITGVRMTIDGTPYLGNLYVDSGGPDVRLDIFGDSSTTSPQVSGKRIGFTFPGGFQYSYVADSSQTAMTRVDINHDQSKYTNAGIQFFMEHALMIDYDLLREGWK